MDEVKFGARWVVRCGKLAACVCVAWLLAGCEGSVTMDLAVELPADRDVRQVLANVTGVEFISSDSATERLEFSEAESIALTDHANGNTLRLVTDEELPEGNYTGVRLLFDGEAEENGSLIDGTGQKLPIIASEGDYAAIDVKVKEDESSSDSLTLTLDLRQSLTFDDDNDKYTLTPVLRSVPTEDAASIQGTITAVCGSARLDTTAAVYLFQGKDIAPDDRDGVGVEPYATTPIVLSSSGLGSASTFSYVLRFLPPGDYTIALACDGNEEDPGADDDLDFENAANVAVDAGDALTHNI